MANKVGRKPLDYLKISKRIKKYIADGLRPLQAARLAGISNQQHYDWLKERPEYVELIGNAEAELERIVAKHIKNMSVSMKNVNGLVAFAERRFQDRWSTKTTTELQGKGGEAISFKIDASGGFINPTNVVTSTLPAKTLEPS